MLALAFTNDCVETTCAQSPKTKGRHSQLTQHSSTSDCIQLNAKWEMGKQTTEVTSEHTAMSVFEEVLLLKRARKKIIHLCTQTKWFQMFAVEYFDVSRSGIASSCLEFNVRLTNLGSRVLPTYSPSNFCTPCATRMSAAGQCMLQKNSSERYSPIHWLGHLIKFQSSICRTLQNKSNESPSLNTKEQMLLS